MASGGAQLTERLIVVATLRVRSPRLRRDESDRLVEEPELLVLFAEMVEAMKEKVPSSIRLGEVCIGEGAYTADLLVAENLFAQDLRLSAMLECLDGDCQRLEENGNRDEPLSALECGVGAESVAVLEVTLKLSERDHPVDLVFEGGDARHIPAPERKSIIALPPIHERKARKVHGEVHGIGLGDDRGSSIRLAKGAEFIVAGLKLDDAWQALSKQMTISAVARWQENAYMITEYELIPNPQLVLGLSV